ncbi:MAG TPA: BlaI/MecI/CopY family transcriptional regulator [Jatrophihabitans sp.]|nr:BlaI/MecI/CopY family transcriptional regulator [Jatrophihabitans sp.]
MRGRRGAGDLESEVLAALWAADRPLTASEVVGAVDEQLAYNTVQTILARLYAKGAVSREQAGRAHAYTPVLDDAGRLAHRMRAVLDAGDDHTAVLTHFIDTLSPEEETVLVRLLGPGERRERSR